MTNLDDVLALDDGTEQEREPDDADLIRSPFDPDRIDVTTRNPTIDLLLSRIASGSIDLAPDFQRKGGIWTTQRQSRLIESLLLRIPLPTLYAAEDENEVWAVVDGVQRLTTITSFMAPKHIGAEPLVLSGLEYLRDQYEGKTYEELPGRLQLRLRETELVLHLIRNGTPEEVKFNIFARINTGGMPLSAQELRHAMMPGQARDILQRMAASRSFREATGDSVRSERMADREMALRFAAFYLSDPSQYASQDFDDFLRRAMRKINHLGVGEVNDLFAAFDRGTKAARSLLGDHAFRKFGSDGVRRMPINKALFEAQAVTLARAGAHSSPWYASRSDKALYRVHALLSEPDFERAVSQGTGDVAKVRLRFAETRNVMKELGIV
ncbi:DUF262 domain-containing protein [Curtobacterium flaccumfaciens]|nr:DUF262 domain-containing protein [Curtobacterium flaccumfaciens]